MSEYKPVIGFAEFISQLRDDVDKLLASPGGQAFQANVVGITSKRGAVRFPKAFRERPAVTVAVSCYQRDNNHFEYTRVNDCRVILGRVTASGFDYEIVGELANGDGGALVGVNELSYFAAG